jgi:hypothetical protein
MRFRMMFLDALLVRRKSSELFFRKIAVGARR